MRKLNFKTFIKNLLLILGGLAVLLVFNCGGGKSASVDFKGKTIEWVIPFKAGGGSDKWSRFYAPMLAKALPGQPNVVVKNLPGGGSTTGANFFAKNAKPDGLMILGTSGSTQFPYLLDDPRVKYEYADWNIVLGTPTGGVVYIPKSLGVKNMDDFEKLKSTKLKYGSQGATSLDLVPLLAFDLLGLDVQAVFGMKGRKAGRLALQRGEANIDYQTSSSYLKGPKEDVEKGEAFALFAYGSLDANGNIVRDPTFPELPSFVEAYEKVHGSKPSGAAFEAWKTFFVAGFPAQKMVFLPKGTPRKIIDVYTKAFQKVISSSDFPEKSKGRLGVYPQATGNNAKILQQKGLQVNAEAKNWVKNWLKEKYGVKL